MLLIWDHVFSHDLILIYGQQTKNLSIFYGTITIEGGLVIKELQDLQIKQQNTFMTQIAVLLCSIKFTNCS